MKIDPAFAKTVNLKKQYHVFVTPHSAKISGLAVVARLPGRFRVEHADGGSGTFSYRVIAKRADINVPRLKRIKMPDLDLVTEVERGRVPARRGAFRQTVKAQQILEIVAPCNGTDGSGMAPAALETLTPPPRSRGSNQSPGRVFGNWEYL